MNENWRPESGSGSRRPLREDARYANFFQIGYNAFEFLLEFGQAGRVQTSIYVSPQHAMMLHELLKETLEKYQAAYGVLRITARLGLKAGNPSGS
jgi:hypothetical protein